jgi:prepilin-type N-terminal cleavage/methylation domain-containing protein
MTTRAFTQRGATLIEMVAVILILAIASVAIMDQFQNASSSYDDNQQIQTATQLAQECAEHLLATRRLQGYATAIATDCSALPSVAGYTASVSFGAAPAACVTMACRQVDVVVTNGATERARLVFMLGDY